MRLPIDKDRRISQSLCENRGVDIFFSFKWGVIAKKESAFFWFWSVFACFMILLVLLIWKQEISSSRIFSHYMLVETVFRLVNFKFLKDIAKSSQNWKILFWKTDIPIFENFDGNLKLFSQLQSWRSLSKRCFISVPTSLALPQPELIAL